MAKQMCSTEGALQPAPGLGCFSVAAPTGGNGICMAVIKGIKSLTRRQGRRGRNERERQKAEEVRCCVSTWQRTQERGPCEQVGGKGQREQSTDHIRRWWRMWCAHSLQDSLAKRVCSQLLPAFCNRSFVVPNVFTGDIKYI